MLQVMGVKVGEPEMKLKKTCNPENAEATSAITKTTSETDYRFIYIDEPIYAQADLNDDGDFLDTGEKFYYVTNTQYSVTAILDTSGDILERYEYTPYGSVTIYTGDGGDGDWWDGDETTGAWLRSPTRSWLLNPLRDRASIR